jgi:hypothetical protein
MVRNKMKISNVILLTISILVGLILCEASLWFLEPDDEGQLKTTRTTSSGTYKVLIPNANGISAGSAVTVNAAGYRGAYYPAARDPNTLRVMIFGDSHTMGVGAADTATYPAVVERILAQELPIQVLNFGVAGHQLREISFSPI